MASCGALHTSARIRKTAPITSLQQSAISTQAKMRLSVKTGKRCAILAPNGAISMLDGTKPDEKPADKQNPSSIPANGMPPAVVADIAQRPAWQSGFDSGQYQSPAGRARTPGQKGTVSEPRQWRPKPTPRRFPPQPRPRLRHRGVVLRPWV